MKKRAGIAGIILALVFLILGFCSNAPDKYIKSYGQGKMYEYVGGDAYNFIIEASLRGGEISGAITAKAIYFGVAGILLIISLSFLGSDNKEKEAHDIVSNSPIGVPVPSGKEDENEDIEEKPVEEQSESDPEEPADEMIEDSEEQPQDRDQV